MLNIDGNKISMTRGDTTYLNVGVCHSDGGPYEFKEGDKLTFSLKKNVYDKEYALQKIINGNQTIEIKPEDTRTLECGRYWYDIQLTTAAGEVFTIIEKTSFCLGEEITNG